MLLSCAFARPAAADGALVVGERELLRQGERERDYCATAGVECDRVKTKVLSGYGYLSGHLSGGVLTDPSDGLERKAGLGTLRLNAASAALPGGDITLGGLDAVYGGALPLRLRVSLLDMEGQFWCSDAQNERWAAPFVGFTTRLCEPDGIVAADAGLLSVQWDVTRERWQAEWLRWGVAFEALANGLGYEHLLRSIMAGLFVDLRSVHTAGGDGPQGVSAGGGLRVSMLYRTPHWEGRLRARYRLPLLAADSSRDGQTLEGELRLVHNFFLTDSIVSQLGVVVTASHAARPEGAFSLLAPLDRHWSAYAGIYLGWNHESPDI